MGRRARGRAELTDKAARPLERMRARSSPRRCNDHPRLRSETWPRPGGGTQWRQPGADDTTHCTTGRRLALLPASARSKGQQLETPDARYILWQGPHQPAGGLTPQNASLFCKYAVAHHATCEISPVSAEKRAASRGRVLRTLVKGKRCDIGLGSVAVVPLAEAREEHGGCGRSHEPAVIRSPSGTPIRSLGNEMSGPLPQLTYEQGRWCVGRRTMWNRLRYTIWSPWYDALVAAADFGEARRRSIGRLALADCAAL